MSFAHCGVIGTTMRNTTAFTLPLVIYINLQKDVERDKLTREFFSHLKYPADRIYRFDAIPHELGLEGCRQSHIAANKIGIQSAGACPYYMVCEDDLACIGDVYKAIDMALGVVADCFLLECGEDLEKRAVLEYTCDQHFMRILAGGNNAGCYLATPEYGQKLISVWEKNPERDVDQSWQELWKFNTVLLMVPPVFIQRAGMSNQRGVGYRNKIRPFDVDLWRWYHPFGILWCDALALLDNILCAGLELTPADANEVLSMYQRGAQWKLVMCMLEHRVFSSTGGSKRHHSTDDLLSDVYSWEGHLRLLTQLKIKRLLLTVISFNSILSACQKAGRWSIALHCIDAANRNGPDLDSTSYAVAARACQTGQTWQPVLAILQKLTYQSVRCSDSLCSVAISSCGANSQWAHAWELLRMRWSAVKIFNSCTDQLGGTFTDVLSIGRRKQKNNAISILDFHTSPGLWTCGHQLLHKMCCKRLEAATIMLAAGVNVCEHSNQWTTALSLLSAASRAR